jgi:hypothetical protein
VRGARGWRCAPRATISSPRRDVSGRTKRRDQANVLPWEDASDPGMFVPPVRAHTASRSRELLSQG